MSDSTMQRREFLKLTLAGAGTLAFSNVLSDGAQATSLAEPHFFIQIVLKGGADNSYLFDARPLRMTAAGKIQNYTGVEPTLWTGSNGTTCWAGAMTQPLEKYKERFSILNGVLMLTSFDGHPQNMNHLFCGNPFGGESFIPHLNSSDSGSGSCSLDAIMSGTVNVSVSNASGIVPLEPASTVELAKKLSSLKPARPGDELIDFIRGRMTANSVGPGRLAAATRLMLNGLSQTPDLQSKLLRVRAPAAESSPERQFVDLVCDSFRLGIAKSALWILPEAFDTHASDQAKGQPAVFAASVEKIATAFEALLETPFDENRSMMDVTTVMVTSEFGRTMREEGLPIDATGTNHNPLSNSVLIAGKGIRGGRVVGSSDFQTLSEALSPVHLAFDQRSERVMGRPFDFASSQSGLVLPTSFRAQDYLTINSVVNTVYSLFGVSSAHYRMIERNSVTPAALIKDL